MAVRVATRRSQQVERPLSTRRSRQVGAAVGHGPEFGECEQFQVGEFW